MTNVNDLMYFFTSYLGINPAHGCNSGCGYCILEKDNPNPTKIVKSSTAKFTLEMILKSDKVSKINGVYYNWTSEAQEKHQHFGKEKEVGVIAQDVEKVLPEIIQTREDGTKAVKYDRLCALLIESVKELKKEIEELKSGA